MAYFPELDDRPLEVRRGASAASISYWPKVEGEGNVSVDDGALIAAPTYSIFAPDGTRIALNLQPTIVARGEGLAYSELVCPIDASNEETYQLLENYRIDITWRSSIDPGVPRLSSVRFSVVREPWIPEISMNDLMEEFADARQFVEGQAAALDDARTADQHASLLGVRAWTEVYFKIQKRVKAEKKIYPRLILDRLKVKAIVSARALHVLFRGEGGGEPARTLAVDWKGVADERFNDLGELEYDDDDDGVEDTIVRAPVNRRLRRSWE